MFDTEIATKKASDFSGALWEFLTVRRIASNQRPNAQNIFLKITTKKVSDFSEASWELLMVRHLDGATNRFELVTSFKRFSTKKASDFSEASWELLMVRHLDGATFRFERVNLKSWGKGEKSFILQKK